MNCILLFCLSNLYVAGDVQMPQPVVEHRAVYDMQATGAARRPGAHEGAWCLDHWCQGPVGEVRIGLRLELPDRWTGNFGILHRSYIAEPDRGYEAAFFSLEWRPFK